MGDKRTVRWGEHVYSIQTSLKRDGIEFEMESAGDETHAEAEVHDRNGSFHFHVGKHPNHQYTIAETVTDPEGSEHPAKGKPDGISARAIRDGGTVWVAVGGDTYRLELEDVKRDQRGAHSGADEVRAPMTGTVLKLLAKVGDIVSAGQAVLVVEAMKMEHTLKAPRSGRIAEIACTVGNQVEAQSVLVTFEQDPDEPVETTPS